MLYECRSRIVYVLDWQSQINMSVCLPVCLSVCPCVCLFVYEHNLCACLAIRCGLVQAAEEAEVGCGQQLQQVEDQMAAIDQELAQQGATQAPASKLSSTQTLKVCHMALALPCGLSGLMSCSASLAIETGSTVSLCMLLLSCSLS